MAAKGIPLSLDERRGLFEWAARDGVESVAESLGCSVSSVANWIAGVCAPFPIQHRAIARRLTSRRDDTGHALREAARSFGK